MLITVDSLLPTQRDLTYDYRNQMVQYTDTPGGVTTTYAYDALGRRVERIVDDGTPETTRYFYDGWQVVEEQDNAQSTPNTLATYVYGLYIDEVLNMRRGGVDYYYHTDDLYNVMAITDASATVVERYEYADYGQPEIMDQSGIPIPQSTIANPYLFTARRYDSETAWHYYRTRYLDPPPGVSPPETRLEYGKTYPILEMAARTWGIIPRPLPTRMALEQSVKTSAPEAAKRASSAEFVG